MAWKYHQRAFYPRLLEIEQWFRSNVTPPLLPPFQITSQWRPEIIGDSINVEQPQERFSKGFKVPFFAAVMLPHIVVFAAGVALFFVYPPQPEKAEKAESFTSGSSFRRNVDPGSSLG